MYTQSNYCGHFTVVDDVHDGGVICLDCGEVLSPIYQQNEVKISHFFNEEHLDKKSQILLDQAKDILDKIHLSTIFANQIVCYLNKQFKKRNTHNLIFSMYKVLNEMCDVPISLKELCGVTGLTLPDVCAYQQTNQNVVIKSYEIVEKYIKPLNLDFKTTSLIKEKIRNHKSSGHAPTTVIAGIIYSVCKNTEKKISVKKISELTSVSQISIQRFLKHARS